MNKNYCKEKKGKIKICGYRNGRGYCGWYENKDGKRMFLRSKKEYIYALFLDKNGKHFLTEKSIFVINDIKYKPDFFIYNNDYTKLIEIIEIKENKKEAERYLKFKEHFKSIGIVYNVEFRTDIIKRKYVTKDELKYWEDQYLKNYSEYSMSGENNPMFGMKHSDETKKKIGIQTKKYMQNEDIKKRHSNSIKNFWNSEKSNKYKLKYKILRNEEKRKRDELNPIIEKKCSFCGKIFLDKKNNLKTNCSSSCSIKNAWKTGKLIKKIDGKKGYPIKIIMYSKMIEEYFDENNWNYIVKKYKEIGKIPKHFGMNLNIIEKYFNNLNELRKKVNGKAN